MQQTLKDYQYRALLSRGKKEREKESGKEGSRERESNFLSTSDWVKVPLSLPNSQHLVFSLYVLLMSSKTFYFVSPFVRLQRLLGIFKVVGSFFVQQQLEKNLGNYVHRYLTVHLVLLLWCTSLRFFALMSKSPLISILVHYVVGRPCSKDLALQNVVLIKGRVCDRREIWLGEI